MKPKIIDPKTSRPFATRFGGAGNGFGGQLKNWSPTPKSIDAALLPGLERGNARADDLVYNHATASGGVQLHIDNVVGHLFRLNYKPSYDRLGITEEDARALALDVESAWLEYAEDPINCYIDAERKRTFTMIIREGIGAHTQSGEISNAAEWIDRPGSLYKTAIKIISPHRISNPNNTGNTGTLKSGVVTDRHGAAEGYWVRNHSTSGFGFGSGLGDEWKYVKREMINGRQQFLHIFEPAGDGQTRGANKMLTIMEDLHSLDKLSKTKLQKNIIDATMAAVIESEYTGEDVFNAIGAYSDGDALGEDTPFQNAVLATGEYHNALDMRLDGSRVAHLLPNEHLRLLTSGNSDNGYVDFERSILRKIAQGMNVSYEQLARDYSQTNYSSARASIMETWRYFMGQRKVIASRHASMIFALWFEEAVNRKVIKLPRKATRGFYEAKASWCNAEWIGSGRLSIDGLKEVKEAVLLIESGLSTYEIELGKMGRDYREVFAQQVREQKERDAAGLPKASWVQTMAMAPDSELEVAA